MAAEYHGRFCSCWPSSAPAVGCAMLKVVAAYGENRSRRLRPKRQSITWLPSSNPLTAVRKTTMSEGPSVAPYEPKPAIQYAARVTMQAAGVGFAMSAIQNALGKHSHGAMGVFTRTGGTIGFFGAWPTLYCMGASRADVRCLLSRQLLWERRSRSLKHTLPTCARRTMLSTALLVDVLPDSLLAYDVWLLFLDVLLSFDILLV